MSFSPIQSEPVVREACWCVQYHFLGLNGEVICEHECHQEAKALQPSNAHPSSLTVLDAVSLWDNNPATRYTISLDELRVQPAPGDLLLVCIAVSSRSALVALPLGWSSIQLQTSPGWLCWVMLPPGERCFTWRASEEVRWMAQLWAIRGAAIEFSGGSVAEGVAECLTP